MALNGPASAGPSSWWNAAIALGLMWPRRCKRPVHRDWGDSVVAHPFAAMLVPLGFVQRQLDVNLDDPRFVTARDDGDEIYDRWAAAPLQCLASLLDRSYLGGA